ncbi:MAG TPA: HlyD family efflux transporter periplasmic adaptor subunit [Polyangiaceae bacterium]|nr:HlyD family efflux transporter periplasmic adaptor subunit [Polyangiaceae bacterium]
MIKNRGTAPLAAAFLALLAGCPTRHGAPEGFQGIVEYDERSLSFEVPGRIRRVLVRRGDVVVAGQELAALDDTLEKLTVDSRREDQAAAQADLALLEAGSRREDVAAAAEDLKGAVAAEQEASKSEARVRSLFGQGALPQAELDKAVSALDRATSQRKSLEQRVALLRRGARAEEVARARARVDQAGSQLALEQERLARHTLRADSPGEVLDVPVEPGELASVGTLAASLADTGHPYVDVFVPEGGMQGVRVGSRASLRVDGSGAAFDGRVEYVSPKTEFTPKFLFSDRERPNLVLRVRVRVDDPGHALHAGVPAFARIEP